MTLTKTGRYYHQPEDIFHLKIPSHGDIPRVFRVIMAKGAEKDGVMDRNLNGLAIEDLGSDEYPFIGLAMEHAYCGQPDIAQAAFEKLKTADWSSLVNFLIGADEDLPKPSPASFYKNVPEIESIVDYHVEMGAARMAGKEVQEDDAYRHLMEAPQPGDAATLIDAGILSFDDEPDLRTEEMKKIDADPRNPYSFPKIGRFGIIAEIEARGQHETGRHEAYLGWYLDSRLCKDMSGKAGGYKVSEEFDQKWAEEVEKNEEELKNQAGEAMFDEWEENGYQTPTEDDQFSYEFGANRAENYIVLQRLDGEDLKITPNRSIRDICNGLPDEMLVKLWKVCRSLDHDTKVNLEANFRYHLNDIRFEKEQEWMAEIEAKPGM
jgi:hypothetical protein